MKEGDKQNLTLSQAPLAVAIGYVILASMATPTWFIATRNGGDMPFPLLDAIKPTLMSILPACLIVYPIPNLKKWRLLFLPLFTALFPAAWDIAFPPDGKLSATRLLVITLLFGFIGLIIASIEVGLTSYHMRKRGCKQRG